MILSGQEILARIGGDIRIDPFNPASLNPNSYNLTLHDELMVYEEVVLDMAKANRVPDSDSARRLSAQPEPTVSRPHRRAHRNA